MSTSDPLPSPDHQDQVQLKGRPDAGRAWAVLAAAFINAFIIGGLLKSSGILYRQFPQAMHVTTTEAAVVATISEAVLRLTGPISGYLAQRINYRVVVFVGGLLASLGLFCCYFAASFIALVFTFGIMFGFGGSLVLIPGDILTNLYFDQYRAMAMGIQVAGGPLGAVAVAPFLEWLIRVYDLHGSLLIYSAIMLHTCASSIVYHRGWWFKSPATRVMLNRIGSTATVISGVQEQSVDAISGCSSTSHYRQAGATQSQNIQDAKLLYPVSSLTIEASRSGPKPRRWIPQIRKDHWTFLSEYKYWIVITSNLSRVMSFPMVLTILPDYFVTEVDSVKSTERAAIVLSAFNIADILGRLGFGWLMDRNLFKRHNGYMMSLLLGGFTAAFFPLVSEAWELFVCTIIFAFMLGSCSICPAVILHEILGTEGFPLAYGTMVMFSSISVFITGPILGKVYTTTRSYKMCFYIISAVLIAGGLLWLVVPARELIAKVKISKAALASQSNTIPL